MVAVTVILAAVIGSFVLGLGDRVSDSAPQASFEYDFDDLESVEITHGGGDGIESDTITVSVDGDEAYPNNETRFNTTGWDSSPISTGDAVTVANNSSNADATIEGGETIRIVWNNPSGGSSNTIDDTDWPN